LQIKARRGFQDNNLKVYAITGFAIQQQYRFSGSEAYFVIRQMLCRWQGYVLTTKGTKRPRKNSWEEQRILAVKAASHEIFPGRFVPFVVKKEFHRYQNYNQDLPCPLIGFDFHAEKTGSCSILQKT